MYRRSRELWPLAPTEGSHHSVTIRIDQLRELKPSAIYSAYSQGETWLLCRHNDQEGVVERHPLTYMQELVLKGTRVSVLKLWRIQNEEDPDALSTTGSKVSHPSRRTSKEMEGSQGSQGESSFSRKAPSSKGSASGERNSGRDG